MTEDELALFRLKTSLQVRDFLIDQLLALVRDCVPESAARVRSIARVMRETAAGMTHPNQHAAVSALAQAEYEAAIQELLAGLEL